ncbi:MAG: O-antigen ligase family protein [Actinomycetia bacterium]|nr:O-antigen ligase family protein [Actinomycetes bacterium]
MAERLDPRRSKRSAALATIAVAILATADVDVESIGWAGSSLGPWHRFTSLSLAWTLAVATGLTSLVRLDRRTLRSLVPVAFLLAWLALSSLTGLHPGRSMIVWLGCTAAALAACAVAAQGMRTALVAVAAPSAAIVYGSLFTWFVFGRLGSGVDSRLAGLVFEPNMLGHLAGLLLIAGVSFAQTTTRPAAVLLATVPAAVTAIIASDTRAAYLGVLIALLAMVPRRVFVAVVAAATVTISVIAVFAAPSDLQDILRRDADEELVELSGRSHIWPININWVLDDPITGAGLASGPAQFHTNAHRDGLIQFSFSSHNLALEIAREAGLVGLGLALASAVAARPWRSSTMRPLFVYLLITGLTMPMSGLPGIIVATWFVVIVVGANTPALSPVRSTGPAPCRQEPIGSNRGQDGREFPIHQP